MADARLKVVFFSWGSGRPVRAAGEGLSERELIGEGAALKGGGRVLKAGALSAQGVRKPGGGEGDWMDCDEDMGQGSISLAER